MQCAHMFLFSEHTCARRASLLVPFSVSGVHRAYGERTPRCLIGFSVWFLCMAQSRDKDAATVANAQQLLYYYR